MSSINQTPNQTTSPHSLMPEFRYLRSHFTSMGVLKNNFRAFLKAWLGTMIFLGIGSVAILLIMGAVDFLINGSDYSALNLAGIRYKIENRKWYALSHQIMFTLLVFPIILNLHKLVLIKITGQDSRVHSMRSYIFLPLTRRLKIAAIMLFISLLITGLVFAVSYFFAYYDKAPLMQPVEAVVVTKAAILTRIFTILGVATIFSCLYLELLFLLNYFFVDHEGSEFTAFKQMLKFFCSLRNIARVILLLINLVIIWCLLAVILGAIMSPFAYAWYYITGLKPLWVWMLLTASGGVLVFTFCSVIFIVPYIYIGSFYRRFCVVK